MSSYSELSYPEMQWEMGERSNKFEDFFFLFKLISGSDSLKVKVTQSCPTLCDPMDCSVLGILQARILEWVAFPFSRGSSQPRDWTRSLTRMNGCSRTRVVLCSELSSVLIMSFLFYMLDAWTPWSLDDPGRTAPPRVNWHLKEANSSLENTRFRCKAANPEPTPQPPSESGPDLPSGPLSPCLNCPRARHCSASGCGTHWNYSS